MPGGNAYAQNQDHLHPGPRTDKEGVLRGLVENGMNVARFNFSHGSHEEHKGRLDALKAIREELDKPVAALLDTKGPEIRLKDFKNGSETLEAGQTFTLTTREVEGTKDIVSITYKDLPHDVKTGGSIMLDDGLIKLSIKEVTDTDIICTVLNTGKIKNKKGVNVPASPVHALHEPARPGRHHLRHRAGFRFHRSFLRAHRTRCV